MVIHCLDVRDLICPLPVLRIRKAMDAVRSGDVLRVQATDPNTVRDFNAFCDITGHDLLSFQEKSGTFWFDIQKQ